MQKTTIYAIDGYPLSAIYSKPFGEPIGSVIISSATGIKKEFYINFSTHLVRKGYNVLIFDYRGIGGSAPSNLKSSDASLLEWGTMDMNAALDFMVKEKGLTDIIWLGHSVGAQLVGFLDQREHISKVIAINAALGYWGYFPFPFRWLIWSLWYFVGPVMVKLYGYGTMKRIGWGENLPKNIMVEWRRWCLSKTYFEVCLVENLNTDKFYDFTTPITAVYTSDDLIANDKTVPLMMQFFPNSPSRIIKLPVEKHTTEKVGHTGIFRRRFEKNLWPLLEEVLAEAV